MGEWPRRVGQQLNPRIDQHCLLELPRQRHHISTLQTCARHIRQVDGSTTAGIGHFNRVSMRLQTTNARLYSGRQYLDLLPDLESAIQQRTGDYRTKACHGEHAIDRQTGPCDILPLLRLIENTLQLSNQHGQTLPGIR